MTLQLPYRLGLPAWAFPGWRGVYFPTDRPMLESYARVFNAVEGNTSFYRTPDAKSVASWQQSLAGSDMKMCLKLPRSVTHERQPSLSELQAFLTAIEPLADCLGPLLVQFPATVGPLALDAVDRLLAQLPATQRVALEVRHPAFFDRPALLQPLLDRYHAGRVVLDSRPIFNGDRAHPEVLAALHAKPDLPVLTEVHNELAFVRLILHPDLATNDAYIEEWAERCAQSIRAGAENFMMIHCPNNLHCPVLARRFHDALSRHYQSTALPPWPMPQQGTLL